MRLAIFGANGPTGRLLTEQALGSGHTVAAVTRHPQSFPLRAPGLEIVEADVYDAEAVAAAVAGCDAVLSTLGTAYSRRQITVYSTGAAHMLAAMRQHGVRRLVVVSSSAAEPHHHADGGFLLNYVVQPLITRTIGRTLYADMRRMEALVRASDVAWTILRPSGLFDTPTVTDYRISEGEAPGAFTARVDLAAAMLSQLTDARFVRKQAAVTTTALEPSLFRLVRDEALSRER